MSLSPLVPASMAFTDRNCYPFEKKNKKKKRKEEEKKKKRKRKDKEKKNKTVEWRFMHFENWGACVSEPLGSCIHGFYRS